MAPEQARFSYVAGVALHDTGKAAEGLEVLQAALSRHPYDRDILYALASYELKDGQFSSARQRAELLRELELQCLFHQMDGVGIAAESVGRNRRPRQSVGN